MPSDAVRDPAHAPRVLLVEDDEDVRAVLHDALSDMGFRVLAAARPSEAIEVFEGASPRSIDLLLTDMLMPEMNGEDLFRRLRKSEPDLRVLFVTGQASVDGSPLAAEARLLEKPFTSSQLARAVPDALPGRRTTGPSR